MGRLVHLSAKTEEAQLILSGSGDVYEVLDEYVDPIYGSNRWIHVKSLSSGRTFTTKCHHDELYEVRDI